LTGRKAVSKIKDNFKPKIGKAGEDSNTLLRQSHLMAATGIFSIKNQDIICLFPSDLCIEKLPQKVQFKKVVHEDLRPVLENFIRRDALLLEVSENTEVIDNEQPLSWEELSVNTPDASSLLQSVEDALESLAESEGSNSQYSSEQPLDHGTFDFFQPEESQGLHRLRANDDSRSQGLMEEQTDNCSVRRQPSPLFDLYTNDHITTFGMDEIGFRPNTIQVEHSAEKAESREKSIHENIFLSTPGVLTHIETQIVPDRPISDKRKNNWDFLEGNSVAKKYRTLFQESELLHEQFLDESQLLETEVVLLELLDLKPATIKQLMKIVKALLIK
jgi:hypothetical protein